MIFLAFYKHVNDIFFQFTCFSHDCHVTLNSSKININANASPFHKQTENVSYVTCESIFIVCLRGPGACSPGNFEISYSTETPISRIFVSVAEWSYTASLFGVRSVLVRKIEIFFCVPRIHTNAG